MTALRIVQGNVVDFVATEDKGITVADIRVCYPFKRAGDDAIYMISKRNRGGGTYRCYDILTGHLVDLLPDTRVYVAPLMLCVNPKYKENQPITREIING